MPARLVSTVWNNRWLRAAAVAVVVASWPACAVEESATGAAGDTAAPMKGNLDYALKDVNGKTVSLADFKGRPILLNFWATWCPPCKAETPYLIELADKYKAQGLVVLGVSFDDSPEDIKA